MKARNFIAILCVAAFGIHCTNTEAQELLSSQRKEVSDVLPVPGQKMEHGGLVINPVPHSVERFDGTLDISAGIRFSGKAGEYSEELSAFRIAAKKGVKLSVSYGKKVVGKYGVKPVSGAYFLEIGKKGIVVAGFDDAGVFYGLQTLRQITQSPAAAEGLPFVRINDYPDLPSRGVVEGFYGTPWSHETRMSLIDFYGRFKMNTYIYGPKDDPFHSSPHWREAYPEEQAANIRALVENCRRNRVEFVWAIHPGQDIRWDEEDYGNLVHKFELMYGLGVRSFAIFFDDISGKGADPREQVGLLNRLTREFVEAKGDVAPLIICPTDYTRLWANPKPTGSLMVYGENLDPSVRVFWTGDAVCSDLTPGTLEWVGSRIRRPALYWWNFPVTDYVRHILMLGPAYGLDNGLSADNLCGMVSNPMEFGEASKLALYGVSDYTWNIANYNPMDNWERGIAELTPDVADAFRTFAIHSCDTETGYRRAESWETKTFEYNNYTQEEFDALVVEFESVKAVPGKLRSGIANKALLAEIDPWLTEFGKLGERGVRTLNLIKVFESGDKAAFWKGYVANLMSAEGRAAYNAHKSGTLKLQPFYENAMNDMVRVFYKGVAGKIPNTMTPVASYRNIVSPSGNLMFDDDSTTYYTSTTGQRTDDWIGADLGGVRVVREISILQGRNSVDDVDYFDNCLVEYSKDGRYWKTLLDSLERQYVIKWKGDAIDARYIRIRKLPSSKRNWAAVRSFEVNPVRLHELGFAVKAKEPETAVYAFDGNPTTFYHSEGRLSFEISDYVKEYILLLKLVGNVSVKQIDTNGVVVSSILIKDDYVSIPVAEGAVSMRIDGDVKIFEIIDRR